MGSLDDVAGGCWEEGVRKSQSCFVIMYLGTDLAIADAVRQPERRQDPCSSHPLRFGSHTLALRGHRLFGSGAPLTDRVADPFGTGRNLSILFALLPSRPEPRILVAVA